MPRISSAPVPTALQTNSPPAPAPNGAVTVFDLAAGRSARPGSMAVLRRPAVAASAAPAGIAVNDASATLVATLAELNALRTEVAAIRGVLNRSYLREDPAAYVSGSNALLGITPTLEAGTVDGDDATELPKITDGNVATSPMMRGANPGRISADLGLPLALSAVQLYLLGTYGELTYSFRLVVEAKLSAADAWTEVYRDAAWAVGNYSVLTTRALSDQGPWRYIRFTVDGPAGLDTWQWREARAIGGEELTQLTYGTAPAAGEQLVVDFARA